ncbi:hypothetical protein CEXT_644241 [Caerostris extrusa]|uniref:Uncharacterized protein n=1 Tax=Caerostris extrusa TaxID=172846 RepID=A0AAV4RV66_CAEEX|nr:hypothetical protein CEXT_644241 [Caerostris extrusa]
MPLIRAYIQQARKTVEKMFVEFTKKIIPGSKYFLNDSKATYLSKAELFVVPLGSSSATMSKVMRNIVDKCNADKIPPSYH